jgi:dihydrofolate synthase/folylpolyglutamate synthase
MKSRVPVVIGERQPEIEEVFRHTAATVGADLNYADDTYQVTSEERGLSVYQHGKAILNGVILDLKGPFQLRNLPGVLKTLAIARNQGFVISDDQVRQGLAQVVSLTGIKGRWQTLSEEPKVICDTGHNAAALKVTVAELRRLCEGVLHLVLGFVNDKDINGMLEVLPKEAHYYFCSATVPRSMDAQELADIAKTFGLIGCSVTDPNEALTAARRKANPEDLIFIGGSTFVVAELHDLA